MPLRLEPLESRQHLTATTRVAPGFGLIRTDLGGFRDVATTVAALPGGRALVGGMTVRDDRDYTLRNVFVMYAADGKRDPSFGRDGVLMLSPQQAVADGSVTGMTALPDGSVLVENNGVRRLKTDGVFDGRFGKYGKLAGNVGQVFVNADGTLGAFETLAGNRSDGGQFRVHTYDASGRETAVSAAVPGRPSRLADGWVVGITADNRVTLYGASAQPAEGFGKAGLVELNAALKKWTAGQGTWYSRGRRVESPRPTVVRLSVAGDGGFIADAVYRGSVRRSAAEDAVTRIPIRLDAKGNIVRVNDSAPGRVGTTFTPAAGTFGGTFRFGTGGPVVLPATVFGDVYASSRPADGSYFLAGEIDGHFGVLRTKPVVGSVKGTAFADANRDGRQQKTEAFAAGTLVYFDANNNGKFDDGEARTATDAAGNYRFDSVGPCSFVVRRVQAVKRVTTPARVQTLIAGNHLVVPLGMAA